ncbi:putative bifunctional diguanylate cyclase/phosphodiesterase [Kineococcus gypseus]|uniref:putative bifunctional diguanylate cyclase/phosphodiesterase n=1 Tax=Kineococcus gypseus TaxID=1637102 RepID=UPI003D7CDF4C
MRVLPDGRGDPALLVGGRVGALAAACCVLLYPLPLPGGVRAALMLAVGALSVACQLIGVRVHRPAPRAAWRLMPWMAGLFLLGAVARPWSAGAGGAGAHLADAFTLSGYLVLGVALTRLVRAHGGLRREVVCDVGIVAAAGALAAARFLVEPTTSVPGRDALTSVLAGTYPLIDVVLLALAVDLVLSGPRHRSHRLLTAATAALLTGDLLYAVYGVQGVLVPPDPVNVPFLLAYLLIALATLDPSQATGGGRAGAEPLDAWSLRRLPLLAAALAALTALVALPAGDGRLQVATALALAVALCLLVLRAVSAVNGQARARAVLQHRASHDPLTGLPNRQELERLLEQRLAAPPAAPVRTWLLYVDLDGFKRVNDTWGHSGGDELLRAVADQLREVVREVPSRAVVARLSGDEFVILADGDAAGAEDLAQRVLHAVERPAHLSVAEVVLSASVGVAEAHTSAAATLRDADTAMYRAKNRGRAQWAVFDESMRTALGGEIELELALRYAVDEGALTVAYQAIVDLPAHRPVGVEALLRWERPLLGPVSPVDFVPVLEDSGLIVPVGRFVLRTAVHQLARWREAGLVDAAFVMSVNVSPRQLLHPSFPGAVEEVLAETGVEGASLTLEITESSVLSNDPSTTEVLQRLRRLGVGLAVDDFGTGYSALSYLRAFPVTAVKVDRSFVSGLDGSAGDAAVVRAVVGVARALGLHVTAEGVETPVQSRVLADLGVERGQGWLWHRAGAPDDVAALLARAGAGVPARPGVSAPGGV